MWRVLTKANRPFPTISDDDVVDYLIIEAVATKVAREDEEAMKAQEKQDWAKRTQQELKDRLQH
jgi:hypothetical protein